MSDVASPEKKEKKVAAKKKPAAKKPADHPKYVEMIEAAIGSLKERKGSSRQAILKYVQANYKVGDGASTHVKLALKRGVASSALKQIKGTGASGSFKLAEKVKKAPAKKAAAKKPAAKKAKKPAAKSKVKKAATPKKKAAKKTPKKAAKKPAAKKPAPKKPAAKKPAVKKAAKKGKKKAAKK